MRNPIGYKVQICIRSVCSNNKKVIRVNVRKWVGVVGSEINGTPGKVANVSTHHAGESEKDPVNSGKRNRPGGGNVDAGDVA
jgi:hypothetical protein